MGLLSRAGQVQAVVSGKDHQVGRVMNRSNPVYNTNGLAEIYTCGGWGHHRINKKSIPDFLLTYYITQNASFLVYIFMVLSPVFVACKRVHVIPHIYQL
jgi:hypothetical protein